MADRGGGPDATPEASRPSVDVQALRALADVSSEAMWRIDYVPERRWAYLNPAAMELFGTTLERAQDDEDAILLARVHPEDHALTQWDRGAPDDVELPTQIRWRMDDGSWLTLLVRFVLIRDDAGHVVSAVGLARPVTEHGRESTLLRSALRLEHEAGQRLRQADVLRQSFIRSVSHELRTPLTAVVGYAETLRHHGLDLPADRSRIVIDRLLRNANRLRVLLDDLLDVDRMSRGTLVVDAQRQDVTVVLLHALESFQGLPGQLEVRAESVVAPVDAPKFERVVDSLVSNSLKHGGSEVTVSVRLFEEDGWVHLVVEDDGPGLDDDLKDRVFAPFEQGLPSADDASPGSGLGLTLVHELVCLHGGDVTVGDSDTGGARFTVRLPLKEDADHA